MKCEIRKAVNIGNMVPNLKYSYNQNCTLYLAFKQINFLKKT
jgi:hypothetical protein